MELEREIVEAELLKHLTNIYSVIGELSIRRVLECGSRELRYMRRDPPASSRKRLKNMSKYPF